jgi:hypothetical protein
VDLIRTTARGSSVAQADCEDDDLGEGRQTASRASVVNDEETAMADYKTQIIGNFGGAGALKRDQSGWTVYRIHTAASQYTLGVFDGSGGARRVAVLQGTSSSGDRVNAQDSDPRITGGRSLFDVPSSEWVGAALEIGTIHTSIIRSVGPETNERATLSVLTGTDVTHSRYDAPREEGRSRPPERSSYPETYVEYAESAATCLRAVYAKTELRRDLNGHPDLERRMGVALAECALVLQATADRMKSR